MTSIRFSEDGAELVDEVDLVEERSSGFELDEEVDVARWRGVASSDGTDDPDRLGTVTAGDLEEFATPLAERVERDGSMIH